jgi:hypothetical protein
MQVDEGRQTMRTKGLGPRHVSHKMGNSDCSQPALLMSALGIVQNVLLERELQAAAVAIMQSR